MTGASGFIGGAVATALAERDHEVIGFGRRPRARSHPAATYRPWDLTAAPPKALDPVDAVVHCAALADDWAALALAHRVNVLGTRAVLRAFPAARIVHLSTSSVYDAFAPSVHVAESARVPQRWLSAYAQTKAEAELELAGRDAVILRPHAVYGPGDTTLLPRLRSAVRNGVLALPEGAEVRHTLTHIDNLVQAVVAALRPDAPGGIYNVGDDTDVLLGPVLRELLERRGQPVRVRSVPYGVAFAAAGALEFAARLARRRPAITRYAVSQLGLERTLDLTRARTRLGYQPAPTSLAGAEHW